MAKVILPQALSRVAQGTSEIDIDGTTAGEILHRLESLHPGLRGWVLDEQGRLRQHVNLFLEDQRADIDTVVPASGKLHILQAISGGSPAAELTGDSSFELLVGTRKGLFILHGQHGQKDVEEQRFFAGQTVDYACCDPRSGRYFAAVSHGQFGPRLFYTDDPSGQWQQADGPVFPADTETSLERVWVVEPGEEEGVLWAGVAPAALFQSRDGGHRWTLNRALWEQPEREKWEGGLGGLCLHSICPWPGDPQRVALGISAAGVWITEDGGTSWRRGGRGLVPRYLPEEARENAIMLCVHNMRRAPLQPQTLYMQFHGGVYRSDDEGDTWIDISRDGRLPADFGFPLVIDPHNPDRAFVIPLNSDEDRVTHEGRLRVFETLSRGQEWQSSSRGLPQEDTHLTVLRQAFCQDGRTPLGLYFGATSGELFASADGGASWRTIARRLPPVLAVRSGLTPGSR